MTTKTIRILLVESDIKTIFALCLYLERVESELTNRGLRTSLTVMSEYSMLGEYIDSNESHSHDIILFDRDRMATEPSCVIDLSKLDLDKAIAISSFTKFNKEAQGKGVKRAVLKNYEDLFSSANKVVFKICDMLNIPKHDDRLYDEAVLVVREAGIASAPVLKEKLRVGYARAMSLLDVMEDDGVIGSDDYMEPRELKINSHVSPPNDGITKSDPLYEEAVKVVKTSGKASASLLQRRLRIGYARSARLLDMLEENGVVGLAEGNKPREIL